MAKASAYFRSLLAGGLQESGQAEVRVNIASALLKPVLRFLYTGDGATAGVDAANATELLGVAGMLLVPELARCCEIEVAANVTVGNVAEVLAMARGEILGAALVAWCEGFALRSLPAEGAVEALVGLPGGAAALLPALAAGSPLREMWRM